MDRGINYLDLFSGVGGFAEGLRHAGFRFKWHGFSEIEESSRAVYRRHFLGSNDLGDIKGVEVTVVEEDKTSGKRGKSLPGQGVRQRRGLDVVDRNDGTQRASGHIGERTASADRESSTLRPRSGTVSVSAGGGSWTVTGGIDLVTFGFPCQDLSIAGKRRGLAGERSGLFFEAVRIVRAALPEVFVFENVQGLLSGTFGRDFDAVLREIADIGLYECEWQLVDTGWFLPQHRERVYFVGHLGTGTGSKVFPIGWPAETAGGDGGVRSATICAGYGTQKGGTYIVYDEYNKRVAADPDRALTLTTDGGPNRIVKSVVSPQSMFDVYDVVGDCGALTCMSAGNKLVSNVNRLNPEPGSQGYNVYGADGDSACVQPQNKELYLGGGEIRRLTPRECERLQGFQWRMPDGLWSEDWTDWGIGVDGGKVEMSDVKRYHMMGNAVSVPVVRAVVERLLG